VTVQDTMHLLTAGDRALGRQCLDPLELSLLVLPHLRGGLTRASADWTAQLLLDHLAIDAAAVVDRDITLAFVGAGADHHLPGLPLRTALTRHVLTTGQPATGRGRGIGCPERDCPLGVALVLPLKVQGRTVGALKLYRARPRREIPAASSRAAGGLARLFGVYLELAELDARSARVTRAELDALRAQISPHFLFNTLTTIAALVRSKPDLAHDLVIQFAEFFRETLAEHAELTTLEGELAHVERYLAFERARLGDERLSVTYRVAPAARRAVLPVLVVQPLVENAINHGLAPVERPGRVTIAADREAGGFAIEVSDDGVGIEVARQQQILQRGYGTGLGMGLSNVHQRLQSLFGPASGLRLTSTPGHGTRVRFTVPDSRPGGP
jgi:two-component system, LytTR family, sensor kinase